MSGINIDGEVRKILNWKGMKARGRLERLELLWSTHHPQFTTAELVGFVKALAECRRGPGGGEYNEICTLVELLEAVSSRLAESDLGVLNALGTCSLLDAYGELLWLDEGSIKRANDLVINRGGDLAEFQLSQVALANARLGTATEPLLLSSVRCANRLAQCGYRNMAELIWAFAICGFGLFPAEDYFSYVERIAKKDNAPIPAEAYYAAAANGCPSVSNWPNLVPLPPKLEPQRERDHGALVQTLTAMNFGFTEWCPAAPYCCQVLAEIPARWVGERWHADIELTGRGDYLLNREPLQLGGHLKLRKRTLEKKHNLRVVHIPEWIWRDAPSMRSRKALIELALAGVGQSPAF